MKEAGLLTDKLQIVSILLCVAWKACSRSVRKQLLFAFGSCKNRPSVRVEKQNDAWVLFAARAMHPVLSVETPFLSNFKYILHRDYLLCHVLDSNLQSSFSQKCSCYLWRLDYDCAALYTMIHITRPTSRKIRKLFSFDPEFLNPAVSGNGEPGRSSVVTRTNFGRAKLTKID